MFMSTITEEEVQRMKEQFMSVYDVTTDGRLQIQEDFLRDLFLQHNKMVAEMKIFDKNKDGRLDLNDLARILALQENFLLQFKMDACSQEERRRDFEKIFAHYDVSKTGALEGPEVDGFVKDMMELVKPSISGVDLDKFRQILLNHCDVPSGASDGSEGHASCSQERKFLKVLLKDHSSVIHFEADLNWETCFCNLVAGLKTHRFQGHKGMLKDISKVVSRFLANLFANQTGRRCWEMSSSRELVAQVCAVS
ncbi:hypothetical protein IHE44_0000820 [Lamprotornis superbus]|uniref:EF-hand domain-containing protein n=1 Tax=Lamprotornis superbus TaxID=245042 RepID=A0A835NR56_9PASS|nr:hypothetical protein IHE44_0000820 [Lamprotornis superbus]